MGEGLKMFGKEEGRRVGLEGTEGPNEEGEGRSLYLYIYVCENYH